MKSFLKGIVVLFALGFVAIIAIAVHFAGNVRPATPPAVPDSSPPPRGAVIARAPQLPPPPSAPSAEPAYDGLLLARPWTAGGTTVNVQSAAIATVNLTDVGGRSGTSNEPYLIISIEVKNGTDDKKLNYKTWDGAPISLGDDRAALADDKGNSYRIVDFGIMQKVAGHVTDETVYPGKSVSDVLIFERPVAKASSFDLELPGKNIGQEGKIAFHFSASKIEKK